MSDITIKNINTFLSGEGKALTNEEEKFLNTIFKDVDKEDKEGNIISNNEGDGLLNNNEWVKFKTKLKTNYQAIYEKLTSYIKKANDDINYDYFTPGKTIDPDMYSLEMLQKRFPKDKYTIEQEQIFEGEKRYIIKSGNNILLTVYNNDETITTILHEALGGAKQDKYHYWRCKNGEFRLDEKKEHFDKHMFCDALKELLTNNGSQNKEQEVLKGIKDITSDNVIIILKTFKAIDGVSLLTFINNLSTIDNKLKQEIISHIENAVGYQENKTINNQQIINKECNYIGDSYDIEWSKDNVIIKNNNNMKTYHIDLNKILKNYDNNEKKLVIGLLQKLPGEVLADLSIEISSIKGQADGFMVAGKYKGADDSLAFNDYDILTIIHELGHAVDYTFYKKTTWYNLLHTNSNLNSTSNNKEFMDAFKEEISDYVKNGHSVFDPENPGKEELYNYATYDEREMFAECYTLITTGNCNSKECLLKYFPKTIKAAKNHLNSIRSLPVNSNSDNQTRRKP